MAILKSLLYPLNMVIFQFAKCQPFTRGGLWVVRHQRIRGFIPKASKGLMEVYSSAASDAISTLTVPLMTPESGSWWNMTKKHWPKMG